MDRISSLRETTRTIAFGLLAILSLAGGAQASEVAALRGRVHDSSGVPLAGALVAVQPLGSELRERLVFTDRAGIFSISNLAAGEYQVRITKASFLPVTVAGVGLAAGADHALTINLQTAMEVVRRGVRRGALEDMKWVLRSSPSTRPPLRILGVDAAAADEPQKSDPSGYVQLYSTTLEGPAGTSDSVGSQFAVTMPLAGDAQVTVSGQYSELPDQPRGLGANYQSAANGRQKSLAVNLRQGALFAERAALERREIRVEYDEELLWSDRLVLSFGASAGRAEGIEAHNYLRPEIGATWAPTARATLQGVFSRKSPGDSSDPIRGQEYFDRAVYIPPELESYAHSEIGATYTVSELTQLSAAFFRDELGAQAFLIDAEDGRRGLMILSGANAPATGVRFFADRAFRLFEGGVGYTWASAVGFDPDVISPDDLVRHARRGNFHIVTARVKAEIPLTQTTVTAVYRWASGIALTPLDSYQRMVEFNDPTLSITLAQDLPNVRAVPARFQAVVDARNLFEPSFGSRRTVHAAHPRLLKGGIHIRF